MMKSVDTKDGRLIKALFRDCIMGCLGQISQLKRANNVDCMESSLCKGNRETILRSWSIGIAKQSPWTSTFISKAIVCSIEVVLADLPVPQFSRLDIERQQHHRNIATIQQNLAVSVPTLNFISYLFIIR